VPAASECDEHARFIGGGEAGGVLARQVFERAVGDVAADAADGGFFRVLRGAGEEEV